MKQKIPLKRFKQFEEIAERHFRIETLMTRCSDDLDFHDCAVWSIVDALESAYKLGQEEKV